MAEDDGRDETRFLRLLRQRLRELAIGGIISVIALFGVIFRDELGAVIKENLLYGSVGVTVDDQELRRNSRIVILDGNQTPRQTFLLSHQSSTKLPPGSYIVQVFYPGSGGSEALAFEEPFNLRRREKKEISPVLRLPNAINVRLEIPKSTFVAEEQISFVVTADRDGYLWLFSPDTAGNPNLFFPDEGDVDNRIQAGRRYAIPPHQEDSFTLQTSSTPGEEVIVCIVTKSDDLQLALSCLSKVVPHVSVKVHVTSEPPWGYDKKTITVE